jgi:hypothetical protein
MPVLLFSRRVPLYRASYASGCSRLAGAASPSSAGGVLWKARRLLATAIKDACLWSVYQGIAKRHNHREVCWISELRAMM